MNTARYALPLLLLVASAAPATAHPDYSTPVTTLIDAAGATFTVVLHYHDGIAMTDPVRLEIHNSTGQSLAETRFTRDISFRHTADGTLYAFAVDHDHVFWHGWVVEPGRLVELPVTARTVGLALLAHLTDGQGGYGFTVLLCVVGLLLYVRRIRTVRSWRVEPPTITYLATGWSMLAWMYTPLSLLIVAGLTVVITLPVVLLTRRPTPP